MTPEEITALQAKAASEGSISQEESQALYDHHRAESLANTIDLLWQAYDAAWHLPMHQSGRIAQALREVLFEQALLNRQQQQQQQQE